MSGHGQARSTRKRPTPGGGAVREAPAGSRSIVLWEQDGCSAAVALGDDPELRPGSVVVNREEAKALTKREFVFLPVLFAAIAPVATGVPAQSVENVLGVKRGLGVWRNDRLP
jgi:hypothetical protein